MEFLPILISAGALVASVVFGVANLSKQSDKDILNKIDSISNKLDSLTGRIADTDKQVAVLTYRLGEVERRMNNE